MITPVVLRPVEAAAALQVSTDTVKRMLAEGRIPGAWKTTPGPKGHWRIPVDALKAIR